MASSSGWIKLHRQIVDSGFWLKEKFTQAQAWVDLLLLASPEPKTVIIRGSKIELQAGDLFVTHQTLAKRWKWNRRTVAKYLLFLEKTGSVHTNVHTNIHMPIRVISITKWGVFQGGDAHKRAHKHVHTNFPILENSDSGFKAFLEFCEAKKIMCQMEEVKYISLRDEYIGKLQWNKQLKNCVNWLCDKNLDTIGALRIRNWMNKSIQFAKDDEIRRMQEYQDKKFQLQKKPSVVKTPKAIAKPVPTTSISKEVLEEQKRKIAEKFNWKK